MPVEILHGEDQATYRVFSGSDIDISFAPFFYYKFDRVKKKGKKCANERGESECAKTRYIIMTNAQSPIAILKNVSYTHITFSSYNSYEFN